MAPVSPVGICPPSILTPHPHPAACAEAYVGEEEQWGCRTGCREQLPHVQRKEQVRGVGWCPPVPPGSAVGSKGGRCGLSAGVVSPGFDPSQQLSTLSFPCLINAAFAQLIKRAFSPRRGLSAQSEAVL